MRVSRSLRVSVALGATLTGFACAAAGPRPATPAGAGGTWVAGYHAYWTGDAWREYPWDSLDAIYFFEIEAGADGSLDDTHGWPGAWSGLIERAGAEGVPVVPTISLHDADAFEALFSDPLRSGRLVEEILALMASTPTAAGVHLDFEVFRPVRPEARAGYTAFAARLSRALREEGKARSLSIFTLAFDDADAYDERSLGEIADHLVVQGYDLHHADGPVAGPLAAIEGWGRLNWDGILERYGALGIPADRLVMAVPLYGYEWPVTEDRLGAPTRGTAVTLPLDAGVEVMHELPRARERAETHGVQTDPESRSPFYAFHDGTGWRQGWFDDERSLSAKRDFVRARGLAGIALFPLAYGDSLVWREIRRPRSRARVDPPR